MSKSIDTILSEALNSSIRAGRYADAISVLETARLVSESGGTKNANIRLMLAKACIQAKAVSYRRRAKEILEDLLTFDGAPIPEIVSLLIFNIYTAIGPFDRAKKLIESHGHYLATDKLQRAMEVSTDEVTKHTQGRFVSRWDESIEDFGNQEKKFEAIVNNERSNDRDFRFSRKDSIFAAGSCFARNISREFRARNYDIEEYFLGEEINTTDANLSLFRLLVDKNNLDVNNSLRDRFLNASIFVMTLGVGWGFFDKEKNRYVYPSDVPVKKLVSDSRYCWKLKSIEECVSDLEELLKITKGLKNFKKLFLTVSPIPMAASFSKHGDVVIDDVLSKNLLRLSAHYFSSKHMGTVIYFPSFEYFRVLPCYSGNRVFGADDGNSRHANESDVASVIDVFCRRYIMPDIL